MYFGFWILHLRRRLKSPVLVTLPRRAHRHRRRRVSTRVEFESEIRPSCRVAQRDGRSVDADRVSRSRECSLNNGECRRDQGTDDQSETVLHKVPGTVRTVLVTIAPEKAQRSAYASRLFVFVLVSSFGRTEKKGKTKRGSEKRARKKKETAPEPTSTSQL